MAEEKDTDSAPDDGVTESDAVTPSPRHGIAPETPEPADVADETPDPEASADPDGADEQDDSSGSLSAADESADDDVEEVDPDEAPADDSDRAEDSDESESDADRELVGVGAAAKSRQAGARSGGQLAKSSGRAKKDKPTPKQRAEVDKPKRTTPLEFVRGAISELKKVVYPTGSQLANYFVVVLVFVLLVIAIVTALDYGFGWAMLKVFS